ncbi:MAG: hypothetical protein WCA83_10690, partial [Azonexus sp.]
MNAPRNQVHDTKYLPASTLVRHCTGNRAKRTQPDDDFSDRAGEPTYSRGTVVSMKMKSVGRRFAT